MAKINYEKFQDDSGDLYGILLAFCGLICMVSAILGIKFKWFKHRLNFESSINELNSANTNSTNKPTEIFRSTATVTYKATPFEVGVFRKKSDDEFDFERPKTLPPIIVKSSAQIKLPKKPTHHQQLSANTLSSTSYQEYRPEKKSEIDGKTTTTAIHTNKSHSSHSKDNQNRSNIKSPKKDRHHHNHQSHQTSKEIESKRNHKTRSTEKQTLLASENSKLRTKQSKENSVQSFTPKLTNSNKNYQMENKKNIKKKIKFDETVNETKNHHSANFQRRPTGFTKLSKEELEELEALSEQGSPIQKQRTRRPTGFELLSKEEFDELEDIANNNDENSIEKKLNSIKFHDFEEEDNNPLNLKFNREFSKTTEKEDEYGFINNDKNDQSSDKKESNNYPGVIKQENGELIFKITGFSDNEEDDKDLYSNIKIKTENNKSPPYNEERLNKSTDINFEDQSVSVAVKPEPQPRTSLRHSKDNTTETIKNTKMTSSLLMTTASNNESKIEQEEDSWSAVRNYRNITEEMAKHNQAIREAAKEKAARRELRNPLAYDDTQNNNSTKPKNMKDVKRRQHENEEREKKSNQKVSLNNDNNDDDSEISC